MGKTQSSPPEDTVFYQAPDGRSFGVTVPRGYKPSQAELDNAYSALTARQQAANPAPSPSPSTGGRDYDLTIDGRPLSLHWDHPTPPTKADIDPIVAKYRQAAHANGDPYGDPAITGQPVLPGDPNGTRNTDTSRGKMLANQALANAAAGLGLPTVQRGDQVSLPPDILRTGITPYLQNQQQAQQQADDARQQQLLHNTLRAQNLGQSAVQQAATLPAPVNRPQSLQQAAQLHAAHNADQQREQQMQAVSQRQAARHGSNLNQLMRTVNTATGDDPNNSGGFDAALADQHGFYGGLARGSAAVLNDPATMAMMLGLPLAGPLLGADGLLQAAAPALAAQQGVGLAQGIANIDASKGDLPGQIGEQIVPGLLAALGAYGTYRGAKGLAAQEPDVTAPPAPADVPAPTSRRPNRSGQPAPAPADVSAQTFSNGETATATPPFAGSVEPIGVADATGQGQTAKINAMDSLRPAQPANGAEGNLFTPTSRRRPHRVK